MWYSGLNTLSGLVPSVKMTNSKLNKWKNNFVFQNECIRNILDSLNRYTIKGLPDTCSERVILQSLLWTGTVYFFDMKDNLLALPGAPDGSGLNVYGDYGGAWVWGANGFNQHIKLFIPGSDESKFLNKTISSTSNGSDNKGVMVRENQLLYPFMNQVIYYSERQADTLRKIEVAEKNAATPYIITAEQSIINTVKEYFKKRDDNEAYILDSGIFPADRIQLLPFDIQADSIKVMSETYDWYCSHFRELCGVKNSTNIDKKGENLITPEVNINDQYTSLQSELPQLQKDIDTVNKIFGTSLVVEAKGLDDENIQSNRQNQFVSPAGGSDSEEHNRRVVRD